MITIVDDSSDYESLSYANEAFAEPDKIHVAIANPQKPNEIIMSRHSPIGMRHMTPGSTLVMLLINGLLIVLVLMKKVLVFFKAIKVLFVLRKTK